MRTVVDVLLCSLLTATACAQEPLDLGFEAGRVGGLPAAWVVTTKGWTGALATGDAFAGEHLLRIAPGDGASATGVCMRTLDADDYCGKRIALRARLRTGGTGQAQMWMRVDCNGGRQGAFDNMHDRPVRATDWQVAVIELDVDRVADDFALGFLALGGATVEVDALTLQVIGDARPRQPASRGPLGEREADNLVAATRLFGLLWFFHPTRAAVELREWDRFAVALVAAAGPARDAEDLARRLAAVCTPLSSGVQIWPGGTDRAPAPPQPANADGKLWSWRHYGAGRVAAEQSLYQSTVVKRTASIAERTEASAGVVVELGGGVAARVPTRVFVPDDGKAEFDAAWLSADVPALSLDNRSTRLGALAMAWNVFEHFYPYFDVVDVDWEAALRQALAEAADAADTTQFVQVVGAMVAQLEDGHGYVQGGGRTGNAVLPVRVAWAGDDLVVVGRIPEARDLIAVGEVVVAIDERPVLDLHRDVARTISASTEGFRRHRAEAELVTSLQLADPTVLRVRGRDGTIRSVSLPRGFAFPPDERKPRPAMAAELAPGVVYFDLDQAEGQALDDAMPALAAAKGIVFDMRGYPGGAAYQLMEHLISEPGTSARWIVGEVSEPGRDNVQWTESGGWRLQPRKPHLGARIAFLTDGRAISYAESIMGIVEAYRLGDIVGSTTAGTNGNVNPFSLPGGITISWTGMRVLKHDGSQHHGVGIAPTVPVVPTAAGIAAGRDEVLEKAVAVLVEGIGR